MNFDILAHSCPHTFQGFAAEICPEHTYSWQYGSGYHDVGPGTGSKTQDASGGSVAVEQSHEIVVDLSTGQILKFCQDRHGI